MEGPRNFCPMPRCIKAPLKQSWTAGAPAFALNNLIHDIFNTQSGSSSCDVPIPSRSTKQRLIVSTLLSA